MRRLILLCAGLCFVGVGHGQTFDVSWSYPWVAAITGSGSSQTNGDTQGWTANLGGVEYAFNNDGAAAQVAFPADRNMRFFSYQSGLKNLTDVNAMTNYGAAGGTAIGACNGTSALSSWKSAGLVGIASSGCIYATVGCQEQSGNFRQIRSQIIRSCDNGVNFTNGDSSSAGTPVPTTYMFADSTPMDFAMWVQYNAGNANLSGYPDSADTYTNGFCNSKPVATYVAYACRILTTDLTSTPFDATKYTVWNGSSWTAWNGTDFGSPSALQCVIGTTTRTCGNLDLNNANVSYWNGLSTYVMTSVAIGTVDGLRIYTASTIKGPWYFQAQLPQYRTDQSTVKGLNPSFPNVASSTIHQIGSTSTYCGIILYGGASNGLSTYYGPAQTEICLSPHTANATNQLSGLVGNTVGLFPGDSLTYLWLMESGALNVDTIKDFSPKGNNAWSVAPNSVSQQGLLNVDATFNGANASISLPTQPSLGDYTYIIVARSRGTPASGAVLLGGPNTGNSTPLINLTRKAATTKLSVYTCVSAYGNCNSAGIDTSASMLDGNWFGIMIGRSGSTMYLAEYALSPAIQQLSYVSTAFVPGLKLANATVNGDANTVGSFEVALLGLYQRAFTEKSDVTKIWKAVAGVAARRGFTVTY